MNSTALSDHLGISDRTIRDWIAKGICNPQSLSMAVSSVIEYYKGQVNEAVSKAASEDQGALYQEKVRLTAAQADKVELENKVRNQELLEAVSVTQVWERYLQAATAVLENLPVRLAQELSLAVTAEECRKILEVAIDEVRQNLGGQLAKDLALSDGYNLDSIAADTNDGEPMG